MDFSLNSDQQILRDTVRQFMETEMRPVLRAYEREEKFPAAELRELGELGCCGMLIPEEWGGAGMDTVSYVVMLEEVARVCASTAVTLSVTNSVVAVPIWKHGTDEQKKKYLTRLAHGEILGVVLLDRAAGWLGRGGDSDARGARGRFLRVERDEKLGVERRAHGRVYCVCEDGSRGPSFVRASGRKGRDCVSSRAVISRFSHWRDMKIRWGCAFRSRRRFR